jgi:WNK lysine deficient protein kinase
MLKELQHPNIVRFYEYWEDTQVKPKKIILVTELMTSGTLKAYVQRFKKQEPNKRLKVIKNFANQILKGLAYLHSRSVIHRDLKCDNVFVTGQSGQVKIGDLGLATLKKTSFAKSVIGTPEFMAPEMYSEQYDENIDVYAFGMCLLEMATGEYPYQECSKPFEIYKRVTSGIKPENYYRVENDDLRDLIFSCIRLKSKQRPTVKELVNHSWFMEGNGLKLEVHRDKDHKIEHVNESQVTFRLKCADKTKRKVKWPDNEEIEFIFDFDRDDPEQIIKELRDSTNFITDEDIRYLVQYIKDKTTVSIFEREDQLQLQEEKMSSNISSTSLSSTNTEKTLTQSIVVNDANAQNSQQQQQLQHQVQSQQINVAHTQQDNSQQFQQQQQQSQQMQNMQTEANDGKLINKPIATHENEPNMNTQEINTYQQQQQQQQQQQKIMQLTHQNSMPVIGQNPTNQAKGMVQHSNSFNYEHQHQFGQQNVYQPQLQQQIQEEESEEQNKGMNTKKMVNIFFLI